MALKSAALLILAAVTGSVLGSPKSDAAKQVLDIVNNPELYNKDIMPYPNRSGPLDIYCTMWLRNLEIDDVNMMIIPDLTFRMSWRDHRLSYSLPGITVRFSDVSKFWIPDIFFKDSFETRQMETVYPEEYIQISHKGEVLYSTRLILKIRCPMGFQRFPHDVQECFIRFSSYGFSSKDIVFHFKEGNSVTASNDLMLSDRFYMDKIDSGKFNTETATGMYSGLQATISISRLFTSYLMEWYVPCMCFVVLAFCSEFMAASSLLPRLVITVAPLLTLTACSLNLSLTLASVPYVRALDLFVGISACVIFATVLHVIIGYYYHTKPDDEAPKPDVEADTKLKKFAKKLREKANDITRAVIIGFYCGFIFLYFLAYSR